MNGKPKPLTQKEAKFIRMNFRDEISMVPRVRRTGRITARDIFNEAGVTVERLARKINELLDATQTLESPDGVHDFKEIPAVEIQLKALGIAAQTQRISSSDEVVRVNPETIFDATVLTDDELNQYLRLMAKMRRTQASGATES